MRIRRVKSLVISLVVAMIVMMVNNSIAVEPKLSAPEKNSKKEAISKNIKPKLIWQMEFDEKIVDVVLGEPTKIQAMAPAIGTPTVGTPTTKAFPIKAIVTKKAVKFLDEKRNIISIVLLEEYEADHSNWGEGFVKKREVPFVSPNGQYVIKAKYGYEDIEEMNLYNKNGELIKRRIRGYDPLFSPDSSFFITFDKKEGFFLYDKEGHLKKEYDMGIGCKISANGNYIIVRGWDSLFLLDNTGERLWYSKLKDSIVDVDISANGDKIAVTTGDKILSYSKKGNLLWQYKKLRVGNKIAISPDGQYIAVKRTKTGTIHFFDNIKGTLVWVKSIKVPEELDISSGTSLSISSRGNFIVFSTGSSHKTKKNYVYLFNKKGKRIWKKEFDDKVGGDPRKNVKVNISPNGRYITVNTVQGKYLYENLNWQAR
jgi:dipeptidyl aminopeptidase/acylaminoacyl peptidase